MTLLFNRFLEVRFLTTGINVGGRQEFVAGRIELPPSISFDVTHTSASTPNEARIAIMNMAAKTQQKLLKEGDKIELVAGYWPVDGNRFTGPIFRGQIRSASTRMAGGIETVTEIVCGDGDDAYAHAQVRKNFGRATHKTITDEIVTQFKKNGVKPGTITIPDYTEKRSRTVDRPARRELDDICLQHDLQWLIQDGKLNVWPRDEALKETGMVLEPETGVIDAPEFNEKGVNVRTLMIPDLRPGMTFTLRNRHHTERAPGQYKIEQIQFSGDNHGGDFGCAITALSMTSKAAGMAKVKRSRERFTGGRT